MRKILDLLNDWRDTIFYIFAFAVLAGAIYFGVWADGISIFLILALGRELLRMMAWIFCTIPTANMNYITSGFFTFALSVIDDVCRYFDGYHWWHLVFLAMNLIFFALFSIASGGPKNGLRMWWKNLFDYPRKQKPPKRHKESQAMESIKRLLAKIADMVPAGAQPQGVRITI